MEVFHNSDYNSNAPEEVEEEETTNHTTDSHQQHQQQRQHLHHETVIFQHIFHHDIDNDDVDNVNVNDHDNDSMHHFCGSGIISEEEDPSLAARALLKRLVCNGEEGDDVDSGSTPLTFLELEEGYLTDWFHEYDYKNHNNTASINDDDDNHHQQQQQQQPQFADSDNDNRIASFFYALQQNQTLQHVSVSGEFITLLDELWSQQQQQQQQQNPREENDRVTNDYLNLRNTTPAPIVTANTSTSASRPTTTATTRTNDKNNESEQQLSASAPTVPKPELVPSSWLFLNIISTLPKLMKLEIQEVIDFDGYKIPIHVLQQVLINATNLQCLILRFVELSTIISTTTTTTNSINNVPYIRLLDDNNNDDDDQEEIDYHDTSIITRRRNNNNNNNSFVNKNQQDDQAKRDNEILIKAFTNHPSLQEVSFAQLRLGETLRLDSLLQGIATIPNLHIAKIHMAVQREQQRRNIHERIITTTSFDSDDDDDIDGIAIGRQGNFHTLCQCKTLQVLELSSLGIMDESKMFHELYNNSCIRDLFLSHSELSFMGWAALAHLLQKQNQQEREKDDNNEQQQHSTNSSSTASLEKLRLDSMIGLDDGTVQLLCHALTPKPDSYTTLQELRLYNVIDMGKAAWYAVSEMIRSNASLLILSLENCQGMNDYAIVGIANALKHNTALQQLELQVFAGHCTRFSAKIGQKALVDVLRYGRNTTLQQLNTQATGHHEILLELYLKLNRTGLRPFVLEQQQQQQQNESSQEENSTVQTTSSSDIVMRFWNKLSPYMDDLDVLFYVMQTNPCFVLSCLRTL